MLVKVKLKNLTTDFIEMGFNYVVPLIEVPFHTQESKNGPQGDIVMSKQGIIWAIFDIFRHKHIAAAAHFLTLECEKGLE